MCSQKHQNLFYLFRIFVTSRKSLAWKISSLWNPLAIMFVMLNSETSQSHQNKIEVKKIFEIMHKLEIWQSFVLVIDLENQFTSAWTWFPYENKNCGIRIGRIEEFERCDFNKKYQVNYNKREKLKNKISLRNLNFSHHS